MSPKLRLALDLAEQIDGFPLGKCGPSDDPDMQTAYLSAFSTITTRFLAAALRINDPELTDLVSGVLPRPEYITEAYEQRDQLLAVIDYLREVSENPDYEDEVASNTLFIAEEVMSQLRSTASARFDLTKLIRFCDELNDAYRRGNYLSSALLIRAVMNHVPPVFGQTDFKSVASNAGRSVKPMLERLEKEARPIADLHTHILIRPKETLPTRNQVEPYKGSFELLLQEVIAKV